MSQDLTSLPTIHVQVLWRLSKPHPSAFRGSKGPVESWACWAPRVYSWGEGKRRLGSFNLTGGPDFGHRSSICVNYDQLQEVCSTADLSLPTPIFDFVDLTICSVPVLSDLPVFDTSICTFEATLETSDDRISALELQVASKEAEMAVKVAQVYSLHGRVWKRKEKIRFCWRISINKAVNCVLLRQLIPAPKLLSICINLIFRSSVRLSHHCTRRWVDQS